MKTHNNFRKERVQEEGYFPSMTDMMVGLLFIFILMLMYYALQFKEAQEEQEQTIEKIKSAEETRSEILLNVKDILEKEGIIVTIDQENGVLRLPENVLRFGSARADLTKEAKDTLKKVAIALNTVLPCYAFHFNKERPEYCEPTDHLLESVFIEGHTDSDRLIPSDKYWYKDNWDLSVARSVNTFREIINVVPDLAELRNNTEEKNGKFLLSVSGYGENRPIASNESSDKDQNRRIDLRFLMATPKSKDVDAMKNNLREFIEDGSP